MATFTNDLIVSKLKTHYPATPKNFGDLWKAYWADALGGNGPGGKPKVGQALFAHYGGSGSFADRARAFWTAYVP
jgi:hypothetical protein